MQTLGLEGMVGGGGGGLWGTPSSAKGIFVGRDLHPPWWGHPQSLGSEGPVVELHLTVCKTGLAKCVPAARDDALLSPFLVHL